MAILSFPYSVRDSSNSTSDNRKTGLTPTVSNGKTLAALPASVTAAGNVSVVEVGWGDYVALYDPELNGDASFPIDWGSALSNPNDRYGTLILTRDAGRILGALSATGAGLQPGAIDLTQYSSTTRALLFGERLMITGTTSPATADTWLIGGLYNGDAYYFSPANNLYAWNNTNGWTISSSLGTNGSAYFTTAPGARVDGSTLVNGQPVAGSYSAQGTATISSMTVATRGNAKLSAYQPAAPPSVNAVQLQGQTIAAAAPVAFLASVGTATPSTAQSGDAFARLGAPVSSSISADIQTRSTFAGGSVASVTGSVGSIASSVTVGGYSTGQDPATLTWGASTRSLSSAGLDAVKGWGTWSARQTIQAIAQVLFGQRTGVPVSGTSGTINFTGPASIAYGSVTVDTSGNVTSSSLTPPA